MANSHQKAPNAGFFARFRAGLKRLCRTIFPTRRDNFKQIAVKLLFTVSLVTLIVSSIYLADYFLTGTAQRRVIDGSREIWHEEELRTVDKFDLLREQNPDIRAWVSISNTLIDNPVYQAEDDEYYLTHNQNGERSRYGAVYLSCNDVIDGSGSDRNLVIYGHNMIDGSMFGTLKRLRTLSFYKENPIVRLETPYSGDDYRIFAIFLLNADPADDNGTIFNITRDSFADAADFDAWTAEVLERSLINTGVNVEYGDHLLTLMTCASDFNDARLVVMARTVRPDEENVTDTSNAVVNASPRQPKRWYDDRGLSFPY